MAAWNLFKKFGVWTTIRRWHEPFAYRARLQGDFWVRLGIALAIGLAASAALLFLFAINNDPPPAAASLFGLLIVGTAAALYLLGLCGQGVSGDVRLCEEGIIRTRNTIQFGHTHFEELSWPYEAMGQATIVPGQSIGMSFSLLFISSPGSWEMIGVPRKIVIDELARQFAVQGVPVCYADTVPEEFTRGMGWTGAIASLCLALPLFFAGLIFYHEKVPAAGGNLAAANRPNPPPRFVPPQVRGPEAKIPIPRDVDLPQPVFPNRPAPAADDLAEQAKPSAPDFAGQPARRGPPAVGPPRFGRQFGPGIGLPPSFGARRGGPRAGDNSPVTNPPEPIAEAPNLDATNQSAPSQNAKKFFPAPPSKTGPPVYNPPPWFKGQPTALLGGPEGFQFEKVRLDRKAVIGFRYRMGRWANQPAVAQLEPLYDAQQFAAVKDKVVAREGYVVGGLQVVSDDLVNAVRIIFVREQTDGELDKTDNYLSAWIGDPGDATPKPLGDGRTRIIGVCGRRGAVLNAVALVLDKE